MPFLFVNRGEIVRHDTSAAAGYSGSVSHDSRISVSNQGDVGHDTRAAITNERSALVDTAISISAWGSGAISIDTRIAVSNQGDVACDTRCAIGRQGVLQQDTLVVVNPGASFIWSLGSVFLLKRPVRPYGRSLRRLQIRELDGSGDLYVYSRGGGDRIEHRLVFRRVDQAAMQSVVAFVASVAKGVRHTFIWIDYAGAQHTVRLISPEIKDRRTGPDRYDFEITLEEIL